MNHNVYGSPSPFSAVPVFPATLTPSILALLAAPELTGAPGGGLGLPICKGIARTLGGGLSAVPAPGGGTMISIALPIPPEAAP